ncbi:MAG: MBL fold metallo-hydrolase [Terriglobia bacterium]|jgi:glyoxylase-like metal-dependent hydrolase (beta-lactamase superfamily II)
MRLTAHCFAVTGLGYATPWCVNAGFVAGEETTLIVDAGGNTLAAQTLHGYAATARPGNKLTLINTEKHFDHIGGNSFFHGLGIEIWGHPELRRTQEEFEAEIAEVNSSIPDPVRRQRKEANAFFYDTHLTLPDHPVEAGHKFSLGGLNGEVLLTPGHTTTNLSVWVPQEGVLYTGDCVVREYLPNLDAGVSDNWRIWLESLDKIDALKPEFIVPGHGPVACGAAIGGALDSMRSVLREAIDCGLSPTSH